MIMIADVAGFLRELGPMLTAVVLSECGRPLPELGTMKVGEEIDACGYGVDPFCTWWFQEFTRIVMTPVSRPSVMPPNCWGVGRGHVHDGY